MDLKSIGINKFKVHVILLFIAAFMLIIGMMNLQGSYYSKDYRCLDGKIVDIEEVQALEKQGFVPRYNYTIVWYDGNVRHKQSVHKAVNCPDESLTKVWVNSDNTNVILKEPTGAKESAYYNFCIAVITFILGMLFKPRKNEKIKMSLDSMESLYIEAIIMAILMAISDIVIIYVYFSCNRSRQYVNPVIWDLGGIFTVVFVLAVVIIVKLRKRLK